MLVYSVVHCAATDSFDSMTLMINFLSHEAFVKSLGVLMILTLLLYRPVSTSGAAYTCVAIANEKPCHVDEVCGLPHENVHSIVGAD